MHVHVAYAPRHLASDSKKDVPVHDRAVPDFDVFARAREPPRIPVAPRFDDHSIVSLVETAVLDEDVFRHLDVDTVVVVPVGVDI